VLAAACVASMRAQDAVSTARRLSADVIRATVTEVAAIVSREYQDADVAGRVAATLRRRLSEGHYETATTADALAARLTQDLETESQDKHLGVTLVRPVGAYGTPSEVRSRQDDVRRTNAGVQRAEILAGNVGYLNITSFWRLEEARDAITSAMDLLSRADALIVDLRQNPGGSPGTVALLIGYAFDQPALPLFDIVARAGERNAYATPAPGVAGRDEKRPMYVLISERTFSGGEGYAFLLQERRRAEVIGERTRGGANPGRPFPVNALFEVTVPTGRLVSAATGKNWEGIGVTPDITVPASDALRLAHSTALRRLIGSAAGDWKVQLERELRNLEQ
jgi:C-terminal processing protease CtpA/Prc